MERAHGYAGGAGATGAGVALGKAILGWPGKVRPLCPIRWPWDTPKDLAEVGNATAALLGLPHRISAADIDIRDDYIGEGSGVVTPGSREALALLARTAGILLHPVYTGKPMPALIPPPRPAHSVPTAPSVSP